MRYYRRQGEEGVVADAWKEGHQRLQVKIDKMRAGDAAVHAARERLAVVNERLAEQDEPAVPVPTKPVQRARKDGKNKYGCVVGFSEYALPLAFPALPLPPT